MSDDLNPEAYDEAERALEDVQWIPSCESAERCDKPAASLYIVSCCENSRAYCKSHANSVRIILAELDQSLDTPITCGRCGKSYTPKLVAFALGDA